MPALTTTNPYTAGTPVTITVSTAHDGTFVGVAVTSDRAEAFTPTIVDGGLSLACTPEPTDEHVGSLVRDCLDDPAVYLLVLTAALDNTAAVDDRTRAELGLLRDAVTGDASEHTRAQAAQDLARRLGAARYPAAATRETFASIAA